jgi:hypothetical protein
VIRRIPLRMAPLLAALAAALLASARAEADHRTVFPYRDADFLSPGEAGGGMVVVPDGVAAGEKTPLIVLLHGVNLDQVLHMWFGTRGYPDVAAIGERAIASGAAPPFLLAAPSQTKGAWSGRRMWQDFDLDDFVRAVEAAALSQATVDRDAVFVIGHSGAGCNPDGGLLRVARATSLVVPRAIFAIDTCMDEDSGAALGSSPESARVWVRFQAEIWPRPVERFRATFKAAADLSGHASPFVQVVSGLPEPVHVSILLDTFTTFLPAVLAGRDVPALR